VYDLAAILLLTHTSAEYLILSVSVAALAGLVFVAVLAGTEKERRPARRRPPGRRARL
jgi:hypothetical protein